MSFRHLGVLSAGTLLIAATTAGAQPASTIELGTFARYTVFEETLGLENTFGAGGRFGFFVLPRLEIEAAGGITRSDWAPQVGTRINHVPIHARLVYNQPLHDRFSVLVGASYVRNEYTAMLPSDNGVGGLLGFRLGLIEGLGLRIEGVADYMTSSFNKYTAAEGWNWGVQGGLSLLVGGRTGLKDTDGDGVIDTHDACPRTVNGEPIDGRGCALPKDADEDGVVDSMDRCPGTPVGDAVDTEGCSLPKDDDGDGVIDELDLCTGTPAGAKVDETGCAIPEDRDGDGVPDPDDRCPDSEPDEKVDESGCREIFEEGATTLVLEGVTFESGKAALTADARTILRLVAESLRQNPTVRIEVAGHTDSTGRRETNVWLSQARAEVVRDYLVVHGVSADRLTARGYGPDFPVATNATPAGRLQNRRVELRRID